MESKQNFRDRGKKFVPNRNNKLMEQVKECLRYYHYAYTTEKTYLTWILRYIKFFGGKTHPRDLSSADVEKYLSFLATKGHVSASTQRQALNAIAFLYRDVLDLPLDGKIAPIRSKRSPRPPTVMTDNEVTLVLNEMSGLNKLIASVMYGSGLRLMECIRLRVKDIDFGQGRIFVRGGKGNKDRTTVLPKSLYDPLKNQIEVVRVLHNKDMAEGVCDVWLPDALARKYTKAGLELGWQYLFCAKSLSIDPRSGKRMRHHVMESRFQKAIKVAVKRAGLLKNITSHTFRHSFATNMLENGVNIRMLQKLLGHADIKTTEIYLHVLNTDIDNLVSPLDRIK